MSECVYLAPPSTVSDLVLWRRNADVWVCPPRITKHGEWLSLWRQNADVWMCPHRITKRGEWLSPLKAECRCLNRTTKRAHIASPSVVSDLVLWRRNADVWVCPSHVNTHGECGLKSMEGRIHNYIEMCPSSRSPSILSYCILWRQSACISESINLRRRQALWPS